MLLRHVLGCSRTQLYLAWEGRIDPAAWDHLRTLLLAREAGRPVPYLTGRREFMGLEFLVDERVLIPRPETEVLVEFLLRVLRDVPSPRIVDVGTGSGAIAIAVAHALAAAHILAVDVSHHALQVAASNAERHGVADRILLAQGDLLEAVRPAGLGWTGLDAIASNPPYVAPEAVPDLPREIREYEPRVAVVDPAGGTGFHRRLAAAAVPLLRTGGWLAVEVAAGQAQEVVELIERADAYREPRRIKDLAGIERLVAAQRR